MQPLQLQQTDNDGDNDNISPSATATSPQHQSIVYSFEDDDRPQHNNNMLSQRRYAQDVSNNNNNNEATNIKYHRSLSSSFTDRLRSNRRRASSSSGIEDQQQLEAEQQRCNNHFAIPTILHNRISRSFDTLDDNQPNTSNIDKEWKQQQRSSILTCDTELIIPAPESTTDGSSDELLFNVEAGIESSGLHRDDRLVNNNNVNDNSLDTSFDADEYINGLNPNNNNSTTSPRSTKMSKLTRQATQKVFNALQRQRGKRQHLNKPISLTHQRYHRKSLLSSISSITSAAISSDMNISTIISTSGILSQDTKNRIKSGICCIIFGLCLIGLLYFMLKPLPT